MVERRWPTGVWREPRLYTYLRGSAGTLGRWEKPAARKPNGGPGHLSYCKRSQFDQFGKTGFVVHERCRGWRWEAGQRCAKICKFLLDLRILLTPIPAALSANGLPPQRKTVQ